MRQYIISLLFKYCRRLYKSFKPKVEIPERNDVNWHFQLKDSHALQGLARLAESNNLTLLNKGVLSGPLSFLVVRHPFDRLVSAYLQKLVHAHKFSSFLDMVIRYM